MICSLYDADLRWAERLEAIDDLVRTAAQDAAHIMVRPGPGASTLSNFWERPPASPYVESGLARSDGSPPRMPIRLFQILHLQEDYVPDAYVQQVLTTAQLARISPLSAERWALEDLGNERHLVTARNTAPWLDLDQAPYTRGDNYYTRHTRKQTPDPNTLARARADFAGALLTYDLHRQHPTPVPPSQAEVMNRSYPAIEA